MKNLIHILVTIIFLAFALPLYAQEGGGQSRAIAETMQYVVYAVIALWLLKKIFGKK